MKATTPGGGNPPRGEVNTKAQGSDRNASAKSAKKSSKLSATASNRLLCINTHQTSIQIMRKDANAANETIAAKKE